MKKAVLSPATIHPRQRLPMPAIHVAGPLDPDWCYEMVPSRALPIINLSLSLKSWFLPETSLAWVERFMTRYNRLLLLSHTIAISMCFAIPYLRATAGHIAAVVALATGLPLGLGGLSNLRFEMVRLVLREDNVWFFCFTNIVTQILSGIMYGDLRALVILVDFLGITNIVLIDARLRGIRRLTQMSILGLLSAVSFLCCVLLNRIDQTHGRSLWQYQAGAIIYDVSVSDYVVNGYSTIVILLAKVIYRKRRSMRHATRSSIIECAIFRCHTKLALIGSTDQQIERQNSSLMSVNGSSVPFGFGPAMHLQQLQYVRPGNAYDARNIIFPVRITSRQAFPRCLLILLYLVGTVGFTMVAALSYEVCYGSTTSTERAEIKYRTATSGSFVCTATFCSVFFLLYQRELLLSLLTSFDFMFYSLQVTAVHIIAASLGGMRHNSSLWLVSSWLWTHWVLCLDALTPTMKANLRFHVQYAVPVVAVMLIGHVALVGSVLFTGMTIAEDRATWSIHLFGYCGQLRVLPCLMGRLMILAAWMLRLLVRLLHASNDDAIILRGAVTYANYMSSIGKVGPRIRSISRRETILRAAQTSSNTNHSGVSSKTSGD